MTTPAAASNTYKQQIGTIAGVYNVVNYSATGDGSTDDAVAIQAALDAAKAAGGGTVYFPEGTYMIGHGSDNGQTHSAAIKGGLKIGDNTTVCGAGQGATTVKVASADYGAGGALGAFSKMPVFINDDLVGGNTGIVIRDMTLNGNHTVGFAGVATEMEGIDFENVDDFLITNVEITDVENEALDFDTSDNGIVCGNYIHDNWGNGCHWSRLSNYGRLLNNLFDTNGWGRYASDSSAGSNVDHSTVGGVTSGNTILDGPRGYLQDDSTFKHTFTDNIVWWTDTDTTAYSSKPQVDIVGGQTVCSGNQVMTTGTDATRGIEVRSGAGACQISNNVIGAYYRGIIVSNPGGAIITGNNFVGNNYNAAILVAAASNGRGSIISSNLIENRSTSASSGGIYITSGAKPAIITGNRHEGNQDTTPAITADASGCSISGNTIEGGGVDNGLGIQIGANADDCIVYGNHIGLHTTAGIDIVTGATRTCVYGNNVNDCTVGVVDSGTSTQASTATGNAANIGI